MSASQDRVEAQLRALAGRHNLTLRKCTAAMNAAQPAGGYMLTDNETGLAMIGAETFLYQASIDDVAGYLRGLDVREAGNAAL